jgi:hypothetical protein
MKKVLSLIYIIASLAFPMVARGQTLTSFAVPNPVGSDSLQGIIAVLINVAFGAAGLIAVIYLIVGGYRYITASGNPDAIELAKGTIINSVIGLIIILISFLIVSYVLRSIHVGEQFIPSPTTGIS